MKTHKFGDLKKNYFLIEPQTLECKVKTLIVDFMLMLYHPKACPHCKYAKWIIIITNLKALKTIASYWILELGNM